MKNGATARIDRATQALPERWNTVLKSCLVGSEFNTEADLFLQSALAVHSNYPDSLEPAEAILAGDAFITMAVEALLDSNASPDQIDRFLSEAVGKFDK